MEDPQVLQDTVITMMSSSHMDLSSESDEEERGGDREEVWHVSRSANEREDHQKSGSDSEGEDDQRSRSHSRSRSVSRSRSGSRSRSVSRSPSVSRSGSVSKSGSESGSASGSDSEGEVDSGSIGNKDDTIQKWEEKLDHYHSNNSSYEEEQYEHHNKQPDSHHSNKHPHPDSLHSDSHNESFDSPPKVNLYSQNVIVEAETTDSVNRDSIADLGSIRAQWEKVFHIQSSKPGTSEVAKKGTVRHWDVRIHSYTHNQADSEMSEEIRDNESAIEREVRIAMERDEAVRKEQLQRSSVKTEKLKSEKKPEEWVANNLAPSRVEPQESGYNEMTEADQGSQMWKRVSHNHAAEDERVYPRRQDHGDQYRERSGSESSSTTSSGGVRIVNRSESIIEREIREQREREATIERERRHGAAKHSIPEHKESHSKSVSTNDLISHDLASVHIADHVSDTSSEVSDRISTESDNKKKHELSYEEALAQNDQQGESLIARELREAREREEELLRQRAVIYSTSSTNSVKSPEHSEPESPTMHSMPVWREGLKSGHKVDGSVFVKGHRRDNSSDSHSSSQCSSHSGSHHTPLHGSEHTSTHGTRNIVVSPHVDLDHNDVTNYKPHHESPIDRDIRLAREREAEHRHSKGLPVSEKKHDTSVHHTTSSPSHKPVHYYANAVIASQSMKKYSSSRLQQEIMLEKEREEALRKEGKITSLSEDHIGQPLKYKDIHQQDGEHKTPVKRNFQVPKKRYQHNDVENVDQHDAPATPEVDVYKLPGGNRKFSTGGPASFSFKESRQHAESKIEQELREMREREEELKQVHAKTGSVSSKDHSPEHHHNSHQNGEVNGHGSTDYNTMTKRNSTTAAEWQQRML